MRSKGLAAIVLAAVILPAAASANPRSVELRRRGFELVYNLDREEAMAEFRRAIEADPGDPAAYRAVSALAWLNLFFLRGAVTADAYMGSLTNSSVKVKETPADLAAMIRTNAVKALKLAVGELERRPGEADAHYEVGAAAAQVAAYTASVEGSVLGAVSLARRALDEQGRVLQLDPSRKDTGLIVGSYAYAVANLGTALRWMAHLIGLGGGREKAIRLLEDCAAYPSDVQAEAMVVLVVIYNREKRYEDALRLLATLRGQFRRNRLLWLESGATDMRAGRPAEALEFLETGVAMFERDPRPKAFGEAALWYGKRGAALVALGQRARAEADLFRALAAEGHPWARGRCHLELGKLADLAGDRTAAVAAYRRAAVMCGGDRDPIGVAEAEQLLAQPYAGTIARPGRQ